MKKLTYAYVKEYIESFGYKLLSDVYISNREKLLLMCEKGHKYEASFGNFQKGKRCPECAKVIRGDKRRLSYDYVKNFIENEGHELISTEYNKNNEYLLIKCPFEHIYKANFSSFQQGKRCPHCYGNAKYTYEKIKEYIETFGYTLLSKEYKNNSQKLLIKCPLGHEWEVCYSNFQQGKRCPKCQNVYRYTYDDVKEIIEQEGYRLLSKEYINNHTKLRIMCFKNHIFDMDFNHFRNHNQRCPICNISKGERKIMDWLNKNKIDYIHDEPYFKDLFGDIALLRPDFILPNYKIWIEYDGEFHFKDSYKDGVYEKTLKYDEIKNEYAKENNWKLIRIPYWEFDDIEEILRSYIKVND